MAGTFFKQGRIVLSTATTATAAGTTVLTASSEMNQQFTGATTQQVNLPDASTLQVGAGFTIMNRSTGIVTVKFNDGTTTAAVLQPGTQKNFVVIVASAGNGTWDVSAGGGDSSSASFGINYLAVNPGAEMSTTGWDEYADAAGARPVDGTGGSPTVTWTRSTTDPLRETASFLFTKDAANRQGEGVSFDVTLHDADLAKPIGIFFDMTVVSGTYADGDLVVEWIDDAGGTPVPNQPAPTTILSVVSGASQSWRGYVQTHPTSNSGRFCIHVASTSASAYVLKFDNFVVGPTFQSYGAVISDWQSFTPTGSWTGALAYTGRYRRVGDTAEVQVTIDLSGAPTGTTLTVNMPSGLVIDTTKLSSGAPSTTIAPLGYATCVDGDDGNGTVIGYVGYSSTTAVLPVKADDGAAGVTINVITPTSPFTFDSSDYVEMTWTVPIVGWSSNVLVSSDADTRVVAFNANTPAGTVDGTDQDVTWTTIKDTHGAFGGTSFTAPVPGYYFIEASGRVDAVFAAGNFVQLYIVVNGSQVLPQFDRASGAQTSMQPRVQTVRYLNAGDTVKIQVTSNSTTPTWNGYGSFSIFRLAGPAQIAASEKIFLHYTGNGNTALTANVTNIDWTSKSVDSHNSWSGTVFTAQRPGFYIFQGMIRTGSSALQIGMYVDGSLWINITQDNTNLFKQFSTARYLNAGQTVSFRSDTAATLSSSNQNWLSIHSQG
jgi:hypothetical protein